MPQNLTAFSIDTLVQMENSNSNVISMDVPLQLFKPKQVIRSTEILLTLKKDYSSIELVPETLKILSQIKAPVVIVTIVGKKSKNEIFKFTNFFRHTKRRKIYPFKFTSFTTYIRIRPWSLSRSSSNPPSLDNTYIQQTTGLWINARPHPRNPDVQVILMDTEGLDSPNGINLSLLFLTSSSSMVQLDS